MMQNDYIEFKKTRELGDVLTDTFRFLRKNFKSFFKVLFKVILFPFLFLVLAIIYNSINVLSVDIFSMTNPFSMYTPEVILSTAILYVVLFIYLTFLYAGVTYIVKSYIDNKGVIVEKEVLQGVKQNMSRILATGAMKYALLFIGLMICVLPGIYLCVPFLMIFPLVVFKEKSASDALNECFSYVKENWWVTFATLAIGIVIWYLISFIFSIPLTIYTIIKTVTIVEQGSMSDPNAFSDLPTIILTILGAILQYLTYFFIPVLGCFVFHNLNERRYQTGTLERIDEIGAAHE